LISGVVDTTLRTSKFWETNLTLWDKTTGREVQRIQRFKGRADPMDYPHRAVVPRSFLGMPGSLSVAFSPDGKYLLSAAEDSPITLREVATGKDVRFFLGHDNLVPSLTFSPDGKYALSGSLDESVRLWEIATGGMVRLFKGRLGIVAVAFGPGGKSVLAAARDATVMAWDASTGKVKRSFKGYSKFIRSACFSHDGKYVLLGAHDSTVKVLDVETGTETRTLAGHSGEVTSVAFSPDGKHVLSGSSEGTVREWEMATGRLIRTLSGHSGRVNSVIFSPDGKNLISGGEDGTLRIWDAATGAEAAQLLSFSNGEWMAITPEGYFSPSKEGARLINVRIGNLVYSMENFFERVFSPYFVVQIFGNKKPLLPSDIRKGAGTPPRVRIVKPGKDLSTPHETIPLIVEARDTGGGIDEIRLYHNGVVIGGRESAEKGKAEADSIKMDGSTVERSYEVMLVPGDNLFRAVGFSTDRTESDPDEIRVRQTGGKIGADLHVFVCGVNDYKGGGAALDFGISGARGAKEFFESKWRNPLSVTHVPVVNEMGVTAGAHLFRDFHVTALYDKEATRQRILNELTRMKTKPQDVFVLYFAGQIRNNGEGWTFLPYDVSPPGKGENLKEKGLSSSELSEAIRNIAALKKVVFFDVFKPGGSRDSVSGNLEDSRAMALLARSTGAHVILGSTHQTGEAGITKLGQSLFAHVLRQGLKGEAESKLHVQIPVSDYSSRDRIVTIKSLADYLEKSLAGVSDKYKQEPRSPLIYQGMHDFPLVINKWND
jgi:DNA-binding beta-propeller fold protein YncE